MCSVLLGAQQQVLGGASAFQPICGTDEESMKETGSAVGTQTATSWRERLVIGADFNASVGRGNARPDVCGKYGAG